MKTLEALYEAIESIERLQMVMAEDVKDPDTTQEGVDWLTYNYKNVDAVYQIIDDMRDSLNEVE